MTKDQQLNVIRAKCVEANPTILALQVGCCLRWKGSDTAIIGPFSFDGEDGWEVAPGIKGVNTFLPSDKDWQVIGRPIRLADILLAIHDPAVIVTSHKGEFRVSGIESAYWNLRKDDLTEQTDECVAFLADLIAN